MDYSAVIAALLKNRGLNTRDRQLAQSVFLTPGERAVDQMQDFNPANIAELEAQIAATRDPRAKAVLIQEHSRIKEAIPAYLRSRGL